MSLPAPATPPSLPLVAADVPRQFARRMLGRLQYIRVQPQAMLDAGCGAGDNLALLRERYAEAAYTGLDNCEPLLEIARKRHAPAGLSAWIGKLARRGPANAFVNADLAATGLAPESLELVWSNLALHWHREPHAVLAEWRRILKVGGLAMLPVWGRPRCANCARRWTMPACAPPPRPSSTCMISATCWWKTASPTRSWTRKS